jgi:hypothetical protein
MTTASVLISDIRTKVGDASANFLSTDLALTWLDQGQRKLVQILKPLRHTKGFVVSANQDYFDVPDNAILIQLALHARDIRRPITRVNIGEFELARSRVQNATGYPTIWTEKDGKIYVWPRYNSASLTTTVNATTEASNTTLTLASTGNLRSYGRAILGSEEVEYRAKTSTTLTGVTRGVGGTTAASYASGQTVTQVDFEVTYSRHAVALASTTEPEIKEVWHEDLQYYVMYLYYMSEGNLDKANAMYALWKDVLKQAEYTALRQHIAKPLQVKDFDSQRTYGFWGTTT